MDGHRCYGLMCTLDLLVGARGSGHDSVRAWRCAVCGEIIDLVIVRNRIRLRDQRCVGRQKKPRQPVLMVPAF
jgi:phosphodiesterase/alkaline phosphatase D-like protein